VRSSTKEEIDVKNGLEGWPQTARAKRPPTALEIIYKNRDIFPGVPPAPDPPAAPAPPRLARWLVAAAASTTDRRFVRQELDDEFQRVAGASGTAAARRWYRRQALASAPPLVRARLGSLAAPPSAIWRFLMTSLSTDLRHTLRRWRRNPGFVVTAILTLALGIGSTTAIFSVVNAVLLAPLPWRDAHRLATVSVVRPHWRTDPTWTLIWDKGQLSWPIVRDLQTRARTIEEVGTYSPTQIAIGDDTREIVDALAASSGLFPLLGVPPALGRFFTPEEDDVDTGATLISEEAWRRRFGGSADVLDRRVTVADGSRRIVGVVPAGFRLIGGRQPEFFLPWGRLGARDKTPGNHFLNTIVRLREGVGLDAAHADLEPLVRGVSPPEEKGARLQWLDDAQLGSSRQPLWILLAASAVLLLIACSNAAGLFLAQAESRRHELAVRAALGGGRRRLVRELMVESLAIGAVAAAAGLALAAVATPALVALAPTQLPRIDTVAIDVPVVAFAIAVALITAVVFGLAPALTMASISPSGALREAGRTPGLRRTRAHGVIVACQVALAVVLLVGASLLGETVMRLTSVPVGFDPANVVLLSGGWPAERLTEAQLAARTDGVLDALRAVPGVVAAAGSHQPPFSGVSGSNTIEIEGRTYDRDPTAVRHMVTDRYFETLRLPIVKGRGFEASDRPGEHVAVVSAEFERRYLDGEAIGRRFILNGDPHTVVGVVADAKQRSYADPLAPTFYGLHRQQPNWLVSTYLVRVSDDAAALLPSLRAALRSHAPRFAVQTTSTLDALMGRTVAEQRYRATLAIAFGGAALLLATVGLYGLIARGVSDRRREIGLRMALGAQRGAVLRFVMGEGARLVAAGLIAGVPVAALASRAIGALLFGVAPTAAHTFVLVAVVLAGASFAATIIPARRASRIDPMVALRD
jgi:putative ABC transport system permease protein